MNIRPATAADAAAIAALERAAIVHNPWGEAQITVALNDTRYLFYVAEAQEVFGYAFGDLTDDGLSVDSVAVEPSVRGKGVGRALLTALFAAAVQRSAPAAFLEVDSQNASALALYQNMGFSSLYTRKNYYAEGLDALVMMRKLP